MRVIQPHRRITGCSAGFRGSVGPAEAGARLRRRCGPQRPCCHTTPGLACARPGLRSAGPTGPETLAARSPQCGLLVGCGAAGSPREEIDMTREPTFAPDWQLKLRVWVERDGQAVLGDGR